MAIAFFAMVLAICGLGGSNAGKEAVNNNVLASNYFSFYQAKNVRQSALELAADEIELGWLNDPALPDAAKQAMRAKLAGYQATIARYESEPSTNEGKKELMARARDHERLRDRALKQDPYFDYAEALLQIAIVLISVSIIASVAWLAFLGGAGAPPACCSPSTASTCWWRYRGWREQGLPRRRPCQPPGRQPGGAAGRSCGTACAFVADGGAAATHVGQDQDSLAHGALRRASLRGQCAETCLVPGNGWLWLPDG